MSVGGACRDCGTPLGIAFELLTDDEMRRLDAFDLPLIGGMHEPNFGIPIIDIDIFRKAVGDTLEEGGVRPEKEYDSINDQCSDLDFCDTLLCAAQETADKFDKEIEANAKG